MNAVLDEVYQRMRGTGPEFDGWLSNHGPMAADALLRLDRADIVDRWVDDYMWRLNDAPRPRWKIDESEWRGLLGDPSRLGDWLAFFTDAVREEPWTELLNRWWPRLLPGVAASATHGVIRTGHAVRALTEDQSPQRLGELAQALGYWAARWQPVPHHPRPTGDSSVDVALDGLPNITGSAGFRARLADIADKADWGVAVGRLAPIGDPAEIPAALDRLVDAAVTRYHRWGHGSPIMLVHAATAPRAIALVLPVLPHDLWVPSYAAAWSAVAMVATAYRPTTFKPESDTTAPPGLEEVIDRTVITKDEHAIKFTEVALESHRRGNPTALLSANHAATLIGAQT